MNKLLLFVYLFLGSISTNAQEVYFKKDSTQTVENVYVIKLKDGTRLKGKIIEQNLEQSKIQTLNMGLVTVQANQIVSMELDKNQASSENPYYENRFLDRVHFMPTAFPMKKGDIDYHNYYLYYNEFSFALGGRVSFGAGAAIVPGLSLTDALPYNVKAKVTLVSAEKLHLSVSGYLIGAGSSHTRVIIPTISIGKKESFLTISPLLYSGTKTSGSFGLAVSYVKKTAPNLTFFTENFFGVGTNDNDSKASSLGAGFRFDRKRHAFDLSLNMAIFNSRSYSYSTSTSTNSLKVSPFPSVGYHLKLNK
jgi:hypothetical protein